MSTSKINSDGKTASLFLDTARQLTELAIAHRTVLVGFSGGKDSLVCLDLAMRTFPEVIPYYYYFVPGMEYVQQRFDEAKKRYPALGDPIYFPHPNFIRSIRLGFYRDTHTSYDNLPEYTCDIADKYLLDTTKATLVITGEKAADGLWRKRQRSKKKPPHLHMPIWGWSKHDVLAFLSMKEIPVPREYNPVSAGTGLTSPYVLWLYDFHPADYLRLKTWFPYVEAIVQRRKFFFLRGAATGTPQ